MPTSARLKDVASRANVSEMTVSRVMRNSASVSEHTRRLVLEAAASIGYVPNRIAGALASNTTNLLAVIVPSLTNYVFPEVLAGIHDVIDASPLQAVFGVTDYDVDREERLIIDMLSWRPSGLIVVGLTQSQHASRLLRESKIPIVQMMDIDGDPIEYNVGISHLRAGAAMAQHFVERGLNNIAYIGAELNKDSSGYKRFMGFKNELKATRCRLIDSLISPASASAQLGRDLTAELLSRKYQKPIQAIHYTNDVLALGGMLHCLTVGISIPEQLALSGFAGLDMVEALPVSLTTIVSPRREIGRCAASYVLAELESSRSTGKSRRRIRSEVLEFHLRKGEST